MKFTQAISFKLVVLFVSLLLIAITIVGVVSYQKTKALEYSIMQKKHLEEISPKFTEIFQMYETKVQELLTEDEMAFQTYTYTNSPKEVSNMPNVNNPVKTAFYETYLTEVMEDYTYTLNTFFATDEGEFYLSNLPPDEVNLNEYDPKETDWYDLAVNNPAEVVWTEPYLDTGSGKPTITLARTIEDDHGEVIGVFGLDFDMHGLALILRKDVLQTTVIVSVVTLIIGIAIVYYFARRLRKGLGIIRHRLSEIADGELFHAPIHVQTKDEINELAMTMNMMQANLQSIMQDVGRASTELSEHSKTLSLSAEDVNKGADQVAMTMQELATGSETQAGSVYDLSTSMGQFTEDVIAVNEYGEKIGATTENVRHLTTEGVTLMAQSKEQMEVIDRIVQHAVEQVQQLDEQSKEITELVAVIRAISEQTNLLALNAAIEAARAGESGKGFAVVADEVRKLSEEVAHSVSNITNIVTTIQRDTKEVTTSLQEGYEEVKRGTAQMDGTNDKFAGINEAINSMVSSVEHTSSRLEGIMGNSTQMNDMIQDIAAVAEQFAAGVEETSATSEETNAAMEEVAESSNELSQLSQNLHEIVSKFKL